MQKFRQMSSLQGFKEVVGYFVIVPNLEVEMMNNDSNSDNSTAYLCTRTIQNNLHIFH